MKRLLCIDGGGIFGLAPAMILAELESKSGKPCAQIFDMLAGTSTGGIIACGLIKGLAASELVNLYDNRGHEIFDRSFADELGSGWGLTGAKYPAASLEKILQELLGDAWLSQTTGPELLIPATSSVPPVGWFFKSWKASGRRLNPGDVQDDLDFPLWQVARATSAAETYFPPAKVMSMSGKSYTLMDGGTHSNCPSVAAIASARAIWGESEPLEVLSIGTGQRIKPIYPDEHWGLAMWGLHIADICMDGNAEAITYAASNDLGADYYRIQGVRPPIAGGMDDTSPENLAVIKVMAAEMLSDGAAALRHFAA